MKIKLFLLALSVVMCYSCDNNNDDDNQEIDRTSNIRISNISEFKFENVVFNNVSYGDIEPNSKTEYKEILNAYSNERIKLTINGLDYDYGPIDYVGPALMNEQNYTFEYDFDSSEKVLIDSLIED